MNFFNVYNDYCFKKKLLSENDILNAKSHIFEEVSRDIGTRTYMCIRCGYPARLDLEIIRYTKSLKRDHKKFSSGVVVNCNERVMDQAIG